MHIIKTLRNIILDEINGSSAPYSVSKSDVKKKLEIMIPNSYKMLKSSLI